MEKNFLEPSLMAFALSSPASAQDKTDTILEELIAQTFDQISCQVNASLALKTQYVVGNGTVVIPNAVVQGNIGVNCDNGSYANVWGNYGISSKKITEIDYTVGQKIPLSNGDTLNLSVSYFDIKAPELFNFNNNIFNSNANYQHENCALNLNGKVTALGNGYSVSGNCDFPTTDDMIFNIKLGYYEGPIGAPGIVLWTQTATLEVIKNLKLSIQTNIPVYQDSGDPRESSMVGGFQLPF